MSSRRWAGGGTALALNHPGEVDLAGGWLYVVCKGGAGEGVGGLSFSINSAMMGFPGDDAKRLLGVAGTSYAIELFLSIRVA